MAKATDGVGNLQKIQDCYIRVGETYIYPYSLPTISDSHSAEYNSENGIGRSIPTKTFKNGGERPISWAMDFIAEGESKLQKNLSYYRVLQSCTYPDDAPSGASVPYLPPKIVNIKCGKLLADDELSCIIKSVSVSWPTDTNWSDIEYGYVPYKFTVTVSLEVVYSSADLPGQARILKLGR